MTNATAMTTIVQNHHRLASGLNPWVSLFAAGACMASVSKGADERRPSLKRTHLAWLSVVTYLVADGLEIGNANVAEAAGLGETDSPGEIDGLGDGVGVGLGCGMIFSQ